MSAELDLELDNRRSSAIMFLLQVQLQIEAHWCELNTPCSHISRFSTYLTGVSLSSSLGSGAIISASVVLLIYHVDAEEAEP